jgi:protein-tyrosine phosphatase
MPVIVAACTGAATAETGVALIDLHCHILPELDDGALDRRDSAGMARQAANDGIEAICATPHIRHDHDVRIEEVGERVAALNSYLDREGIPVEVLAAGEVAETAVEGLSEKELARISLGAGRWVLLEPAPGPLGDSLERRVFHLAERGHRTLIAHPERHVSADMFERMGRLVAAGALVQATADFFLRERTAAGMVALAERRLVHVLGSDAHSSHGGRPVHLSEAFARLREIEPIAPHVDWIAETAPQAIVSGAELSAPFDPSRDPPPPG